MAKEINKDWVVSSLREHQILDFKSYLETFYNDELISYGYFELLTKVLNDALKEIDKGNG